VSIEKIKIGCHFDDEGGEISLNQQISQFVPQVRNDNSKLLSFRR